MTDAPNFGTKFGRRKPCLRYIGPSPHLPSAPIPHAPFSLPPPNGSTAQLLDVMDYLSNSFLMPFISLLTSILIGWVVGPQWIVDEVQRNGEPFRRAGLYRVMIRHIVPAVMLFLFLTSTGFLNLFTK